MKTALFVISLVVLGMCVLIGTLPHGYVDQDGLNNFLTEHATERWVVSFIVAALYAFWLYILVKDKTQDRAESAVGQLLGGVYFLLFFALMSPNGLVALYNRSGEKQKIRIQGLVMNKDRFANRRKTNHSMFVSVMDTIQKKNYYFQVSDYVYQQVKREETFDKEFSVGRLGILYRIEEE